MGGLARAGLLLALAWAVFVTTVAMLTALTWVGGTFITAAGAVLIAWAGRWLSKSFAASRR